MQKKICKFSVGDQVFLPYQPNFQDELFTVISTRKVGDKFTVDIESFDDGYSGMTVNENELERLAPYDEDPVGADNI